MDLKFPAIEDIVSLGAIGGGGGAGNLSAASLRGISVVGSAPWHTGWYGAMTADFGGGGGETLPLARPLLDQLPTLVPVNVIWQYTPWADRPPRQRSPRSPCA